MARVMTTIGNKLEYYPWFEWVNEFGWEDDEFQNNKSSSCSNEPILSSNRKTMLFTKFERQPEDV